MSGANLDKLRDLITDLMLTSYMGACLCLINQEKATLNHRTGEDLFQSLVRKLYVTSAGRPYELVAPVITRTPREELLKFFRTHNMRGGWFGFLDRTPLIVSYYSSGGWGFRLVEMDPRQ